MKDGQMSKRKEKKTKQDLWGLGDIFSKNFNNKMSFDIVIGQHGPHEFSTIQHAKAEEFRHQLSMWNC